MTMNTEIEALEAGMSDLVRIATAASEEAEAAHSRYMAICPDMPDALRIESYEDGYPVPRHLINTGWGAAKFLWIGAKGWAAALPSYRDAQLKAECEARLQIAERFGSELEDARTASGYTAASELACDKWGDVYDCERRILAAAPVTADDLRIQGRILANDLKHFKPDAETISRFVDAAVRLAA